MPIYDYQCSSCGHKAEVMRKVSAANVEACPQCAVETFSKQLSAPSFQLTGSGWFKGSGSSKAAKPADSAASESAAASSAAPAACATGCACH